MSVLRYKGYEGSAEVDLERGVCHGRIRLIDDLVTYEASNPKDLVKEFEAAVNDYLETCRQLNRAPKKSYGGVFNVRISPEKHCALGMYALRHGISLNAAVNLAFDRFLEQEEGRLPAHSLQDAPEMKLLFVSSSFHSSKIQWDLEDAPNKKPVFAKATAPGEDVVIKVAASVH